MGHGHDGFGQPTRVRNVGPPLTTVRGFGMTIFNERQRLEPAKLVRVHERPVATQLLYESSTCHSMRLVLGRKMRKLNDVKKREPKLCDAITGKLDEFIANLP